MAWVYILKGSRFYIGSAVDLEDRLKGHARGNTPTTRRIGVWSLIWKKEVPSKEMAREMERKIKKWKSHKMIELLFQGKIEL